MFNLACDEALLQFIQDGDVVPLVAITLGCGVGVVGIVAGTISGVVKTRARETSRRELAAYVAEGTIKPEDAVALMSAGLPKWESGDLSKYMARKS
jgi:hypothetical protein